MKSDLGKMREFALRYTAAWCSRDANSVAAFYSPYGSLAVNGEAPAAGPDAIAELARSFMTAFPDLHLAMDELQVRDECTDYHWTLTGTNTGPGGTGNRVRISGFERWRMGADGLIAASQGQFDSADYRRQLGLLSGSV
jgi:SnoaL-like polyketide cyclase